MESPSAAALQHIELMRMRIDRQAALIVELQEAGQDALQATRRLALLHSALEEMRLQLGGLLPSEVRDSLGLTR